VCAAGFTFIAVAAVKIEGHLSTIPILLARFGLKIDVSLL
jgi:hypothetical protein